MTEKQQQVAAKQFAQEWQGRGYEKGESQPFWLALLRNVYGVQQPEQFISFENQVKLNNTSFIDGYIESTHVLIEQKGIDKDLRKPVKQSDGSSLTPFQQAKRYAAELPYSKRPRWVVACNFKSFLVYDMEQPNGEPEEILLENLEEEYYRLQFLVDSGSSHIKKEMEVSIKAGQLVGQLYDELLKQYINPNSPDSLRSLNILCVRLVFCLYAEDAGIFGRHGMFHDYLVDFTPDRIREALIGLFKVLNTKEPDRDPYMDSKLAAFPYVNGGLFADDNIEIPRFNPKICDLLLTKASDDFDWSQISPTIFGAVFESTLNPETRRSGGMHYTSIENIHKVIDPLFIDSLNEEYQQILEIKIEKTRITKLKALQDKLANLKFLDPACGSGNFLTETYLSLRRLENEIICNLYAGNSIFIGAIFNPVKVGIHQFYGIEINDFAVTVATTALWIAESQMLKETERIVKGDLDFLPLKSYANIVEGNALRMDWNEVVPAAELDYIMGNPPFVGARLMSAEQKEDLLNVFGAKWKNAANLDYVCCWYKMAADYMYNTKICAALVSTNSVSQGEQVANLWKPLLEDLGIHLNFAWRTFRWDSEANVKAHVHCVIIGFSYEHLGKALIYDNGNKTICNNLNPYLCDASNIFVESRSRPLCDVPCLLTGSQRIDNDNFMFDEDSKSQFCKKEPLAEKYFRVWYGADEFINNRPRWCLYLGNCSPSELRRMPSCLRIIEKVREYRLTSKRGATVKAAQYPHKFGLEVIPDNNFMIVPVVSSERRRYIPLGFMAPENLCSNQVNLIPNATLYHFGLLESNVHMAWMRSVAGRLKSDYRYSKDIVYNNFPWPHPTEQQKAKIEKTAQAILDARKLYPDCSLADLYDEVTMPPELRKAHQENDRAVMEAYGFPIKNFTESDCVAKLFDLYKAYTK